MDVSIGISSNRGIGSLDDLTRALGRKLDILKIDEELEFF